MRITIVDDHLMVIKGLRTILEAYPEISVVGEFTQGTSLLEWLKGNVVDIILLDIELPDLDGIDLCKIIMKRYPDTKIIAITAYSQVSFIQSMIQNGAKGYLFKNTSEHELIKAIQTVGEGGEYFTQEVYRKMLFKSNNKKRQNFIPKLTRREKEVLELIYEEKTNAEIAETLFITVSTVETHRMNLCAKLKSRNTAGLIKNAIKFGYIQ